MITSYFIYFLSRGIFYIFSKRKTDCYDGLLIESIFNEMYVIPEFQRPYSWDSAPCSELFEDIKIFFEVHYDNEEQYYLGNIVLYRDGEKWGVIDEQKRLPIMMLLLSRLKKEDIIIITDGLKNSMKQN